MLKRFTELTIIQLKMLMMKLTARISKANLRDVDRYSEAKSTVMVGSASVSSDNATAKTEKTRPTQREHKNEHKIMTFLAKECQASATMMMRRQNLAPVSLHQANTVIFFDAVLNSSLPRHKSMRYESYGHFPIRGIL